MFNFWNKFHLVVILLLLFTGCGSRGSASNESYFVKRVIDGDTILLEDGERVRLIGVDTPETKHPKKPVEYFGKEASAFTKKMCEGKNVRLEYDQTKYDKYKRLLAYVYLEDGTFVNAEIVKQGYGHAYTRFPFKYMEEFRGYEREARKQGLGLWKKESQEELVACAMDVKECPDGSYVGRVPPSCEFKSCSN